MAGTIAWKLEGDYGARLQGTRLKPNTFAYVVRANSSLAAALAGRDIIPCVGWIGFAGSDMTIGHETRSDAMRAVEAGLAAQGLLVANGKWAPAYDSSLGIGGHARRAETREVTGR